MSDVIRLNIKPAKLNIFIKDSYEKNSFIRDEEEQEQNEPEIRFQQGYEEGLLKGKAEAEKDYNEKLMLKYEEVNGILSGIDKKIKNYEKEFDEIVLETVFAVADKVIRQEAGNKQIIKDVLRESIKKILGANNIIIKLNPADLKEMNSETEKFLLNESYSKIKFESDEKIEPGGCFVESEIGNVDARISSQINEVRKELEQYLNTQPEK